MHITGGKNWRKWVEVCMQLLDYYLIGITKP